MVIVCEKCGRHLDASEVDEYVPTDYEDGLAIPYENLPECVEVHVWMEMGNLFMHFAEDEVEA